MPLALITVGLLAIVPGFIVALLFSSLLLDRQPQLQPKSPTAPVTVMIAARNEAESIAETLASLCEQDYEGPFDVVAWNNFQVWTRWVERIPEWPIKDLEPFDRGKKAIIESQH